MGRRWGGLASARKSFRQADDRRSGGLEVELQLIVLDGPALGFDLFEDFGRDIPCGIHSAKTGAAKIAEFFVPESHGIL